MQFTFNSYIDLACDFHINVLLLYKPAQKWISVTFSKFFFTSCVENLRSKNMSISTNFCKLFNFVDKRVPENTQFTIPPVKMNELLQDLLNLDINKSTATDNIEPMILKASAPFILSSLSYIFNILLDCSIYPNILRMQKFLPFLNQYLTKYNLLYDALSGFRSNHSCQTAVVNSIDKWIEEMNNGNVNVVIL